MGGVLRCSTGGRSDAWMVDVSIAAIMVYLVLFWCCIGMLVGVVITYLIFIRLPNVIRD